MSCSNKNNRDWYASNAGSYVFHALAAQLQEELSQIFGYYAIEMGQHFTKGSYLRNSRIKHKLAIHSEIPNTLPDDTLKIVAEAEFLPIVFDNIDLFISSHMLEASAYPQQVLREIDRVLMPDGHCFLIGFNSLNYFEMTKRLLPNPHQKTTVPRSPYSVSKISDWLEVLGFEIISTHSYGYRPNIKNKALFDALYRLESIGQYWAKKWGQVYLIHAKKTKFSRISIEQHWQPNKLLVRKPAIAIASKQGNKP